MMTPIALYCLAIGCCVVLVVRRHAFEQETEKMRYDLYYIKNRSLWLDVKILVETAWVMVAGHGATEIRRRAPKRETEVRPALVAPAAVEP